MNTVENPAEARLLGQIADATNRKLPCPPIPFSTLGEFALNGWIENVGDGTDEFVITIAGRSALAGYRPRKTG